MQSGIFSSSSFVWALGSLCALHRLPFSEALLLQQTPPPFTPNNLLTAARALGFKAKLQDCTLQKLAHQRFPLLALMRAETATQAPTSTNPDPHPQSLDSPRQAPITDVPAHTLDVAIIIACTAEEITYFTPGTQTPVKASLSEFGMHYAGQVLPTKPQASALKDPDGANTASQFGFSWFIPELLKHKKVWRDVLLASLILQLLALGTPLFTQTIIDKVVVHRTTRTLIVIAIAMSIFMIFSAILSWVRQYLILHTGNRVDAVLAADVFNHLFKLPLRYFQHRPTGVIAARLHGVETIREFVASAAVTLILDCPFLLICVGIMFWYSVTLSCIVIGILSVIVLLSLFVAPRFQQQLNQQFLLGARNQAFLTEYVAGMETVKSLQLEPQLQNRYSDYLATYLQAGFVTKQLGNTYNTLANTLEQIMTLLILTVGAWMVMTGNDFTIGMLVAFQMFAGKVSQPMLRLVGLWQQFQQAQLAVERLGDVMNVPTEPYSLTPMRHGQGKGRIEIANLGFRYADDLPWLYQKLSFNIEPGQCLAIMGPSGCGKSTLTKLLQGFYLPAEGSVRIDNVDVQHLAANELRSYFGVVPQETILFSGTIYENLIQANPHANFEDVVQACRMAEIHSVIESLPKGYQTEIGERGVGLSGGQRQRLAIARALLKRPQILIFDEATSNLDAETAEHFAQTVNQLKGRVTLIFITHALPKVLRFDGVIKLGPNPQILYPQPKPAASPAPAMPPHSAVAESAQPAQPAVSSTSGEQ